MDIRSKAKTRLLCLFWVLAVLTLSACDRLLGDNNPTLTYDVSISAPTVPSLSAKTPSALVVNFPANIKALEKAKKHAARTINYEDDQFSRVLRANINQKTLNQKIKLEPKVEGNWTKTGNQFTFQPKYHWPANVTYTMSLAPELFLDHVRFNNKKHEFTTRSLKVLVRNSELHTDPSMDGEFRYISTLEFSHPINEDVLQQHYKLVIADDTQGDVNLTYDITRDVREGFQPNRLFYINSEKIDINNKTRFLTASLPPEFAVKGIKKPTTLREVPTQHNKIEKELVYNNIQIPSVDDIFNIEKTESLIVRNDDNVPQQAIALRFSIVTNLEAVRDHLEVKLLPKKKRKGVTGQWLSTNEITPAIEKQLTDIEFKLLPTARKNSRHFSLVFAAPENRQIVLRVRKGLASSAGYISNKDYAEIHDAPQFPTELAFLGEGNVLDSHGTHKIGFVTRNYHALYVEVGRVDQQDLNHLISQSHGRFDDIRLTQNFTMADLAVITSKKIQLNNSNPAQAVYSSYDLTSDLVDKNKPTGVFMIEATASNFDDSRMELKRQLVLITDIGFITKHNADGTRDVFVQKISKKMSLANANVSVLGRNGRSALDVTTNNRGHAKLPNLSYLRDDKEPVAIVVQSENDLAYLPLSNPNRQLNLSRFETGGQYLNANEPHSLSAFMFTDRGLYRPGESVNIAAIVRDEKIRIDEPFSVRISVVDPRGNTIYQKPHLLGTDGLLEIDLDTTREFNTGNYEANLSLHVNGHHYKHLGAVNFMVEEFEPDRLKIKSALSNNILQSRADREDNNAIKGWLNNNELDFQVSLHNLFGAPAQQRKITASFSLNRTAFRFSKYPNYTFTENVSSKTNHQPQNNGDVAATNTDTEGRAHLKLNVNKYSGGTYQVKLHTQGFEQNGGRSVHAQNTFRFSPREYLVGYNIENQFYLKQSHTHDIKLLCIDKYINSMDCDFEMRVNQIETISTLVELANGTYRYKSIPKINQLSQKPMTIGSNGYVHEVNTQQTGKFQLVFIDSEGDIRQTIDYSVVGNDSTFAKLDKDTQLELVLDKAAYAPGDWIELQIKAPYTGSGLISIETEKTHSFEWFRSTTTQSIKRIQVPEGLHGNAYVQVAFVRTPGSTEVFTAPLSYAVAPFDLSKDKFKMNLTLDTPTQVKPGETLEVKYKSTHKGRAIIFAVDEGILQAGNYATPDPLSFFLQKRALQVDTYQMFDLLLPEFNLLYEYSASGGDMDTDVAETTGSNLNPFARKVKDPVAFWSGIVPAGTTSQSMKFDLPDHFDGTLRVMAIALDDHRFDSTSAKVIVKGPFVVTPNLPLAVSPGDRFTVAIGVSNQMDKAPDVSEIELELMRSPYFKILSKSSLSHVINNGDEHTYLFELQAKEKLGSADLSFTASAYNVNIPGTVARRVTATVSIRPATLRRSTVKRGKTTETETIITVERSLLKDRSTSMLVASNNPSILIDGLTHYLDVFPHACTEQIISKLVPKLSFIDHPNYLGSPVDKLRQIESAFVSLGQRQLPSGGFSLWPKSGQVEDVASVHVLHAMIDAEEQEIRVPASIIQKGVSYLKTFSLDPKNMRNKPELTAYALYLLTRQGEQTNNTLIQLQAILDRSDTRKATWQKQLIGAYIASSFKLLHRDEDADKLIRHYVFREKHENKSHYDSALYRDSMVVYLLARHFKQIFNDKDVNRVDAIIEPILNNDINTFSSGRALIALKAYSNIAKSQLMELRVETTETLDDKNRNSSARWQPYTEVEFDSENNKYTATLATNIKAGKLLSELPAYYQATQTGFDANPPTLELDNGIAVSKEILSAEGTKLLNAPAQGDDVLVKLSIRSTDQQQHQAVAIVDLLPGGFEIDAKDARQRQQATDIVDYLDIREDRLVAYATITPGGLQITYKARLSTAGEFTVPATYANAMYDDTVNGHSSASKFTVNAH